MAGEKHSACTALSSLLQPKTFMCRRLCREAVPYLQSSCAKDACSFILGHIACGDARPVGGLLTLLFENLHALIPIRQPFFISIFFVVWLHEM